MADISFYEVANTYWIPGGTQESVSNKSVLNIPAFYSGVLFLSETLASIPRQVHQKTGSDRQQLVDHPLHKKLNIRCNRYATPTITFATWYHHAIVYGNGYLYKNGEELVNLNPTDVIAFRVDGEKYFYIQSAKRVLTNDEVIHIMGMTHDGISGLNPVSVLAGTFERIQTIQSFQLKYFRNGTHVNGVIEVPAGLTKEQMAAMTASWQMRHTGDDAAGRTPILPFGAKWVNTTASNEHSQLMELSNLSIDDVARILRVPPTILYSLNRATWSNIDALNIDVVKYSLSSWINKTEDEFNLKLLKDEEINNGVYIRLNVDALLRGDPTRITNEIALVNAGLLTPNEARALEDRGPLPGGDIPRVPVAVAQPANMVTPDPEEPDEPEEPEPTQDEPTADPEEMRSKLNPVFVNVFERVESKTIKAFVTNAKKGKEHFAGWREHFAVEQADYLRDALVPVAASASNLGMGDLNIDGMVAEYSAAIRQADPAKDWNYSWKAIWKN